MRLFDLVVVIPVLVVLAAGVADLWGLWDAIWDHAPKLVVARSLRRSVLVRRHATHEGFMEMMESNNNVNNDNDNNDNNDDNHPSFIFATAFTSTNKTRVACVGDSITIHACASNGNMTYPAQLQRLLGTALYEVINFGNSGKTMLKQGLCGNSVPPCGGDCSYWNTPTFQAAITSNPDIVTIMLGTNDAKRCNWEGPPNGVPKGAGTQFMADYLDMIQRFQALPSKPKIYVAIPPPLTHKPGQSNTSYPLDMSPYAINTQFPALQRTIAWQGGADGIMDVFGALGGATMDPNWTCDGCHPKDHALTIMAQTMANTILAPPGGRRKSSTTTTTRE